MKLFIIALLFLPNAAFSAIPAKPIFKDQFKGLENQFIAERFAAFKTERSLIFARNSKSQMIHLPMVQSVQINNQCDYVMGPMTHPKEAKLIQKISYFLNQIK